MWFDMFFFGKVKQVLLRRACASLFTYCTVVLSIINTNFFDYIPQFEIKKSWWTLHEILVLKWDDIMQQNIKSNVSSLLQLN